jgi:hypothetical protein
MAGCECPRITPEGYRPDRSYDGDMIAQDQSRHVSQIRAGAIAIVQATDELDRMAIDSTLTIGPCYTRFEALRNTGKLCRSGYPPDNDG